MNKIFVTSDPHFYHENIIKYCNRPFLFVEEMNEKLIENWNSTVDNNDEIYILGDFALIKGVNHDEKLNKLNYLTGRLNGNKHLLFGNHDYFSGEDYLNAGFNSVHHGILELNLNCHWWNMCHYQMTSWNNSHKGTYHLFGHEHWTKQSEPKHTIYSEMKWSERKYNVCMDANNYKPIDLKELIKILDKRNTNFMEK